MHQIARPAAATFAAPRRASIDVRSASNKLLPVSLERVACALPGASGAGPQPIAANAEQGAATLTGRRASP